MEDLSLDPQNACKTVVGAVAALGNRDKGRQAGLARIGEVQAQGEPCLSE